jgi:hypothetical protein
MQGLMHSWLGQQAMAKSNFMGYHPGANLNERSSEIRVMSCKLLPQ